MSEYERPDRFEREPTVEDVRQLMGASTPHFALQLRNRIHNLIDGLPEDHPARVEGEREIARLDAIAHGSERRGRVQGGEAGLPSYRTRRAPSGPGARRCTALERVAGAAGPGERRAARGPARLPRPPRPDRARVHRADPGPDAHRRSCRGSTSAGGARRSGGSMKGVLGPGMAGRAADRPAAARRCTRRRRARRGLRHRQLHARLRALGRARGLVVGIDVSEPMLARAVADTAAARPRTQVAYVRGDAEELPFRDASFDAVCCFARSTCSPTRCARSTDDRVLTPGRPDRHLHERARPLGAAPHLRVAAHGPQRRAPVRARGGRRRASNARLRRHPQRVAGVTQFVGGAWAAWIAPGASS